MPKRIMITVSDEDRATLERWSRQPPKPYLRERARAILLVAGGMPVYQVAQRLRLRIHRNAVRDWVQRFVNEGVTGLKIREGRGRKPAFSPSAAAGGHAPTDAPAASAAPSLSDTTQSLASVRLEANGGVDEFVE